MILLTVLVILLTIASILYAYIQRIFSYWNRMNLPNIPAKFPYGNIHTNDRTETLDQMISRFYNLLKGKGSLGGIFLFTKPAAIVCDSNLIHHILVDNFQAFSDRENYNFNELEDPLMGHLYSMNGDRWRQLKYKCSMIFTPGNLKLMFPMINGVGKQLEDHLSALVKDEEILEIRDILYRFYVNIIASVIFGLNCNSLLNPLDEFFLMAKKSRKLKHTTIERIFINSFPSIARQLRLELSDRESRDFFLKSIYQTIYERESKNSHPNDFLDWMINLKNQSFDSISINDIAAYAHLFIQAGFDTIPEIIRWTLYELMINPDIQQRLRNHTRSVIAKFDGKITYDALMEMDYLTQVIKETLRKYPPIGVIERILTKDYTFPGSFKCFPKGMKFFISILGIHTDPQYYPEPSQFKPERFSAEQPIQSMFLGFGAGTAGPRNCIGQYFAMISIKIALITLLMNYEFSKCSSTLDPLLGYSNDSNDCGLWLSVKKIQRKISKIPICVPVKKVDFQME